MKKLLLVLPLIFACINYSFGQIDWKKYSQSYPRGVTDDKSAVGLMALVPMENNSFWSLDEPNVFTRSLFTNMAFFAPRPVSFVAITTFDTSKAYFILHGVNHANATDFEYRVLQDLDKTIVPWSAIRNFTDSVGTQSLGSEMAYIGGYKANIGHEVIVDIRNKSTKAIVTSAVVRWDKLYPRLLDIYTASEFNEFMARLNHAWTIKNYDKWRKRYTADQLEPVTGLPKRLLLKPKDNNLVFYLNATDIYQKKLIQYEVIKDDEIYKPWHENEFDNSFIWLKDLPAGNYVLNFRYSLQPQNVSTYHFTIETAWYQSERFYLIMGVLLLAFLFFVVFLVLYFIQRQKASRELSKKTKLKLELQTIHAQLNPHFVFNALTSIQGLINKNDIDGANSYLSDFGRLLRNSLSNDDREQVSLNEELKILETYLKLEQLRFKFAYEISVDDKVSIYETEVPSLLLQPLIENAIKHGIAILKEDGIISLKINRQKDDLEIILSDNGNGFSLAENASGFGLKLTGDRIKLLNEMNKQEQIMLNIDTAPQQHTVITLTFKNWLNEN